MDNPNSRAAYDQRQKEREKKARQAHRELMRTLACADCGQVPKEESTWEYGPDGREQWARRPGGPGRIRGDGGDGADVLGQAARLRGQPPGSPGRGRLDYDACYAPLLLWGPLVAVITAAYARRRRRTA
ncbi:hypothetical protein [Kitasatospora sp. HPMI-4]|uniref:hypothetical protein n=1 Tax=Kitasatospora sp. HPMI-4 TaxID=3448443 RepID=UPI003F1C1EB7